MKMVQILFPQLKVHVIIRNKYIYETNKKKKKTKARKKILKYLFTFITIITLQNFYNATNNLKNMETILKINGQFLFINFFYYLFMYLFVCYQKKEEKKTKLNPS